MWVYICRSTNPPLTLINLHLDAFGSLYGGSICTDQGGELARCANFVTQMTLHHYLVESTSADGASQNKQIEKWNDILAVTVCMLLYSSSLPATFWSAALLHAVYLDNCRVHRSIMMTLFDPWYCFKPDL